MKPTCKLSVKRNPVESSFMYVDLPPDRTHMGYIRPKKIIIYG